MASPASTFAWVGFILVNLGFAYLISFGASQHWAIGAAVCGGYAIFLFGFGYLIENNLRKIDAKDDFSLENIENPLFTWNYKNRMALLIDLLFALGIVAVGVLGIIVSVNIYCGRTVAGGIGGGFNSYGWITNTSLFPEDVLRWYNSTEDKSYKQNLPTFTFFNSTGNVLFAGKDRYGSEEDLWYLWRSNQNKTPERIPDMVSPTGFCGPDSTKCFAAKTSGIDYSIICTDDGVDLKYSENQVQWPKYMYWSNGGEIWFMADPPERKTYDRGIAYSMNPSNMEVVAHGVYLQRDAGDESGTQVVDLCHSADELARKETITIFYISALPVLLLSLVLFMVKGISSLTVTGYIGVSMSVICLKMYNDPESAGQPIEFIEEVNKHWFVWSTGLWMALLCIFVVIRRVNTRTFSWGINTSSLLYFVSASILFFYDNASSTPEWVRWVLINVLVYFPIAAIGVLYENNFLTFLGAGIGVLLDVVKVSNILVGTLNSYVPDVVVYFLLFSVSGVVLGSIGWELSKRQEELQRNFFYWAEQNLVQYMPPEEQLAMESGMSETTPLRSKSFTSLY